MCYRHSLTLFRFYYLWRYWYSDVSIIYSFGWLYHYYSFRLWSLVVYNPSDAISTSPRLFLLIFTYHSHLHNNNIVLRSPDLRETSYHFDSTSTSFLFVPFRSQALSFAHRPRYASFYLAPSIIRCFSSRFVNFTPISLVLLLYTSDFVYRPTHLFTFIIRSFSDRILTLYHPLYHTLAT